jgi:hypothetical protein
MIVNPPHTSQIGEKKKTPIMVLPNNIQLNNNVLKISLLGCALRDYPHRIDKWHVKIGGMIRWQNPIHEGRVT